MLHHHLIIKLSVASESHVGSVELYTLAESDRYIKGRSQRRYAELTNLHVVPACRGQGWSHALLNLVKTFAKQRGLVLFLRAVPYGRDEPRISSEALVALYRKHGFASRKRDPREMVLR